MKKAVGFVLLSLVGVVVGGCGFRMRYNRAYYPTVGYTRGVVYQQPQQTVVYQQPQQVIYQQQPQQVVYQQQPQQVIYQQQQPQVVYQQPPVAPVPSAPVPPVYSPDQQVVYQQQQPQPILVDQPVVLQQAPPVYYYQPTGVFRRPALWGGVRIFIAP